MQILSLDLPDPEFEIFDKILSNLSRIQFCEKKILEQFIHHSFLGIVDPWREFRRFEPKMSIVKVWTEVAKLPPKRYIGVGYKDHGTLSTAPSWKDQQTEEDVANPRLSVLSFSLDRILGLPLYRTSSSSGEHVRLTSPRRAKQEKP